ncbi:acyl-CoA-binding domain-containing protein 5A-like isoform X2 [Kryptolebias marmoratus]|uniref:acyl-CoA-binding domain-containing protein 5A-like isoform X2 n=1 Tax=Kryptolebias marmoratus TaxID=37003 RepID=UPI0007F87A75|nr:acyl-CoA-binding domain-containing protein 5A-like isoform X2 [Kryptolebias marmoratus]
MPSLSGLSMAQQQQQEDEEEDKHSLEEKFAAAVQVIRSLPEEGPFQPSDDMMLMFYSYYKQATVGPCNIHRPMGFWDTRGKTKWDAWSSLGTMTKEEAMRNYIEHIQLILETIPISEEVSELVQKLGNFYTEVDQEEKQENETDRRPFTMPFAEQKGEAGDQKYRKELIKSAKRPTMEGYGDLWDDIQNVQEKGSDSSVRGLSVSSEEAEGSRESSGIERKEESCVWRGSEEEENWDDSINSVAEDKEEERDWAPDPRFLMADDKRWRSDTKGSSSSLEPSMSSFTNGTHSSLNSDEEEEEELACSMEPGGQHEPYIHLNQHLSASERNHRPADSDNEEFCDSMEHLAKEELSASKGQSPGSGAASVSPKDLWFESVKEAEGEVLREDFCIQTGSDSSKHNSSLSRRGTGSQSPKIICNSLRCTSVDAASGHVSKSRTVGVRRANVNEQIAAALLRLQHDMTDVLHRLHTLEELTKSQSRSLSPHQEEVLQVARKVLLLRPSWWPLDYSPMTVVLTTFWSLITHWLVQLYLQRRRRKIP